MKGLALLLSSATVAAVFAASAGGGRQPLSASPHRLAFGAVTLGSGPVSMDVTFTNTSGSSIFIFQVVCSGDCPGGGGESDFGNLGSNCNSVTLVPQATCTEHITFDPVTAGHKSATYTAQDATPATVGRFSVSGRGVAP